MDKNDFLDYAFFPFVNRAVGGNDFVIDFPINDFIEETLKSQIIDTFALEKIFNKTEKQFPLFVVKPEFKFELKKESNKLKEWVKLALLDFSPISENILILLEEDYMHDEDDYTTYCLSMYSTEEEISIEIESWDDLKPSSSKPFFSKTLSKIFKLKEDKNDIWFSGKSTLPQEQCLGHVFYVESAILYIYGALICTDAFKKINSFDLKSQLLKFKIIFGRSTDNDFVPLQSINISNLI